MRIKREELLGELYSFAISGGGMVVGVPGIGKSYILRRLKDLLVKNEILCFIVKIDNAYDSSDGAIANELGIDGYWIDVLREIELRNEFKAVLIFDAFDAARDETKRLGFLSQIKKAKVQLKDKWNIIVSARTYDAKKSTDLTRLFSSPGDIGEYSAVRKFSINELSENEIQEASASPLLYKFYLQSTKELKEILHVPFFLQVLEVILLEYSDESLEEIKRYKSETQLLDYFWQRKIDETNFAMQAQKFLLWFTTELVEVKTLSLPKSDLLKTGDNTMFETFERLRSELIIDEVSFKNARIAYAHNIFFDYAVSRLCIEHDYNSLLAFISEDYSRAFFLRPSFVYFFTAVWYGDKEIFWDLFKRLIGNDQKEIKLFVRLIINSTIASQYSSVADLNFVLELNGTPSGDESIRNILQSIRFVRKKSLAQDVELLLLLSKELQLVYLFEFSFLLERIINDGNNDWLTPGGDAARNLLSFILTKRTNENKSYLDRIGSSRGVELVSKTFSTNPEESKQILRSIFTLIQEPGFDINYFTSLADDIKYFVGKDPEFVSEIYKVIFAHKETSDEKTQMGASVVMNFISNRRQDFDMCYYRLEQLYPEFLAVSPEIALITGIDIINRQVYERRSQIYSKGGFNFEYEGKTSTFIRDFSSMWADRSLRDKPEELVEHIITYIEGLYAEGHVEQADSLVKLYIAHAEVGFLWKQLMSLAVRLPLMMFDIIYPLITVPEFLSSSEVSYEVRAFIEKISSKLSSNQIENLENVIFSAYSDDNDYGIQAALSAFAPGTLQTDRAKEFMDTRKTIENRRPVETSFSVTPYSTEEWLKDKGVDVENPDVVEITRTVSFLDGFTHQFLNSKPSYSESEQYLNSALDLWSAFEKSNGLNEDLRYTMLNSIAKTIAIISRNLSEVQEEQFAQIKKIMSFAFGFVTKYDQDQKGGSARQGYSPTPRIEAAESLVYIYLHDEAKEFLDYYKKAITDSSSVVRYNAIKSLPSLFNKHFETYREVLFERLENEKDSFNYAALLAALYFKNGRIAEDGSEVIRLANSHRSLFGHSGPFVDAYSEILLWFLNYPEVPIAYETLVNGYQYKAFCNSVIFHLFKQIHTYEPIDVFIEDTPKIKLKLGIIDHYIQKAGEDLKNATTLSEVSAEVEQALKVVDAVVMRIYFALAQSQRTRHNQDLPAIEENRKHLYFLAKPLVEKILNYSSQTTENGVMLAHTAHYLMQTLNSTISFDPKSILYMVAQVTRYSMQVGYTFDTYAIREIVSLTEKLLADHRDILMQQDSFQDLISILEIHVRSGWVEALELLWKLDEVFK